LLSHLCVACTINTFFLGGGGGVCGFYKHFFSLRKSAEYAFFSPHILTTNTTTALTHPPT
jgi:hypothetical protein